MKILALTIAVAASLCFTAPAFASLEEVQKICTTAGTPPQAGIEACTKLLTNAKMGAQSKMAVHYYRGIFYANAGTHDKAIADFSAAITAYEQDPQKASWPSQTVGVVADSYTDRAQSELILKNCEAAKADYKKAANTTREVSERWQYEDIANKLCK